MDAKMIFSSRTKWLIKRSPLETRETGLFLAIEVVQFVDQFSSLLYINGAPGDPLLRIHLQHILLCDSNKLDNNILRLFPSKEEIQSSRRRKRRRNRRRNRRGSEDDSPLKSGSNSLSLSLFSMNKIVYWDSSPGAKHSVTQLVRHLESPPFDSRKTREKEAVTSWMKAEVTLSSHKTIIKIEKFKQNQASSSWSYDDVQGKFSSPFFTLSPLHWFQGSSLSSHHKKTLGYPSLFYRQLSLVCYPIEQKGRKSDQGLFIMQLFFISLHVLLHVPK